ncbi:MAG: ribose 5-phosphate isomerase B [Acidobacteriota bacterium]
MRIAIGADHAGFELKARLIGVLERMCIPFDDVGTSSADSVDYPDFAAEVARRVAGGRADCGILVCGTGIGMAIAANKVPGVRAAVVWNEESARLSRAHNDANIMAVGGRTTRPTTAEAMLRAFLDTPYEGGRHDRRLAKIGALEGRTPL